MLQHKGNVMSQRQSRRLRGMLPEWDPKASEDCFFCILPTAMFTRGTVLLSCCRRFVHRHCQVKWEDMNNDCCAHCRQELESLFSLRKIGQWSVVQTMEKLLDDKTLTEDLQEASMYLFWTLFESPIYHIDSLSLFGLVGHSRRVHGALQGRAAVAGSYTPDLSVSLQCHRDMGRLRRTRTRRDKALFECHLGNRSRSHSPQFNKTYNITRVRSDKTDTTM